MDSKYINKVIKETLHSIIIAEKTEKDSNTELIGNKLAQRIDTLSNYANSVDDPNLDAVSKEKGRKFKNAIGDSFINPMSIQLDNQKNIIDTSKYNKSKMEKEIVKVLNLLKNYASRGSIEKYRMSKDGFTPQQIHDLEAAKLFIDEKSLAYLYDTTLNGKKPSSQYKHQVEINPNTNEIKSFKWDFTLKDVNKKSDEDEENLSGEETKEEKSKTLAQAYKKLLDRYLSLRYGIDFKVTSFSTGNMKVPKTLIVNFASAMGCPAWDNCVVKHACYARSGERRYKEVLPANERKRMMWLVASVDDEFKNLLFAFLRTIAIKFNNLWGALSNDQKAEYDNNIENLILEPFSSMPQEIKDLIKDNFLAVKNIRFNENGDFLNEDILALADEIATDFNEVGIVSSAYTCRRLDYDNIKTIILNGSQLNLNKGKSGNEQFARIFYAVPSIIYQALEVTCQPLNDKDIEKTPLLIDGTKSYFYKCPCAQTIGNIKKVMCGSCNYCYEYKKKGNPLDYVVVSAHGANAYDLEVKTTLNVLKNIGVFDNPSRFERFKNNLIAITQKKYEGIGEEYEHLVTRGKNKGQIQIKKKKLSTNDKKDIAVIKELFSLIYKIPLKEFDNFPFTIPSKLKESIDFNNRLIIKEYYDTNLAANTDLAIHIVTQNAIDSMRMITKKMVDLNEAKIIVKNNFDTIFKSIINCKI